MAPITQEPLWESGFSNQRKQLRGAYVKESHSVGQVFCRHDILSGQWRRYQPGRRRQDREHFTRGGAISVFANCAVRNSVGLPPIPRKNAEWMGQRCLWQKQGCSIYPTISKARICSLRTVSRSINSVRTSYPRPGISGMAISPAGETVTSGSTMSSAQ